MNPPVTDWRGRRVWLFGASSGIGAALARRLLAEGARVAVSARSTTKLLAVAESAPQAMVLPCDATDATAIAAAATTITGAWGGIDTAIYLAGDYEPMRGWEIDLAVVERTLAINVGGAYAFAAAVVPRLAAQGGGDIALVASVAGYRGLPKALAYGPSKAALINFAEALALDLQPRGIGVRLINPGFVATQLTAKNDFAMPSLLTPEVAANEIVAGYRGKSFEIHFPKRFTRFMKLLALLPARVYLPLVRRFAGG